MAKKFVFDKKAGAFTPKRTTLGSLLRAFLRYGTSALLCGLAFYLIFALVYSTDREQRLEYENEQLVSTYGELSRQVDLIDGTLGHLRLRDREIYNDLFETDPPSYITEELDTLLRRSDLESVAEDDLVWDALALLGRLESRATQVTATLVDIDTLLKMKDQPLTTIPSIVPVKPFSPVQTGASVGKKVSPFFKSIRDHDGIDLVATVGTTVRCTADGRVSQVVRSKKGMGNQVFVDHGDGFQTVYAHLDEIRVTQGQTIRQGAVLGTVGQSGTCFAPCLHYEVHHDGRFLDPVHYFFAELDPVTYHDMTIIALTTGQSLD